jgi:hypothetical protein
MGRATEQDSEVYIRLDTSKSKITVAIASSGRDSEVRFYGDIDSAPKAVERLVGRLGERHQRLSFCYEAGPTGYGLYRQRQRMHCGGPLAHPATGRRSGKLIVGMRSPSRSCIGQAR